MNNVQVPPELEKAWANTCRVLLGEEVGNLLEFEDYLKRRIEPTERRTSVISGKPVTISSNRIPKEARVIAYGEMPDYDKKMTAIRFASDEIKDIDSLLAAAAERVHYAGDIVLGRSQSTVDCHRCINTNYALGCQDVYDGKCVAFTTSIRNPEYAFGCCFGGDVKFSIKILDPYQTTRCMELFHCNVTTDCYYSASLDDCTNCLFSFNQKSRHYLIGNVQLTKDKYLELKTKLIAEIANEFKRKKTLPSIITIVSGKRD